MVSATPAIQPSVLTLNVLSESEIDVSWTAMNDNEDSYDLLRCLYVDDIDPQNDIFCDQEGQFATVLPSLISNPAKDSLAHYRMDEAAWVSGSADIIDVSGNGNNATSYNGANTVAEGYYDRAGSLNGTNQSVFIPVNLDQSIGSAGATFEAWVKPTQSDGARYLFSTYMNSNDRGWGIFTQNSVWYISRGGTSVISTGLPVYVNQWQHVTATFEPGVGIKFYLYKDAVQQYYATSVINLSVTANSNIYMGRLYQSGSGYFAGLLDEVNVYGYPLTQEQITQHQEGQADIFRFSDSNLTHTSKYYYKVKAEKAGSCGWPVEVVDFDFTLSPPPPTYPTVTCDSTSCLVGWQDNNGSETGYEIRRCNGTQTGCEDPSASWSEPAGTGAMSLVDDTVCPNNSVGYTYEIWATGPWGPGGIPDQTSSITIFTTTPDIVAPPDTLSVSLISEVEAQLDWNFESGDETGLYVERCQTMPNPNPPVCVDDLAVPAGGTTYRVVNLEPEEEYCFRVSAYKNAVCNGGWQTTWSGQQCITTKPDASTIDLTATRTDTTTAELSWSSDPYETDSNWVVERCAGDLNACCGGAQIGCGGSFQALAKLADANATAYVDDTLCYDQAYTYRTSAEGNGLSNSGGGCWTRYAPVAFSTGPQYTGFEPFSGIEVVINDGTAVGQMNADFSDIRFYDNVAKRQLQYLLKEFSPGVRATVWLMTGANEDISLYYGNVDAEDASSPESVFTEVYDDFQGTTIDTDKWEVIDPNNIISQNDNLRIDFECDIRTSWVTGLISTATFGRANGNEMLISLNTDSDEAADNGMNIYNGQETVFGWGIDQTTSTAYSQLMHGLDWTRSDSSYFRTINNGSFTNISPTTRYDDKTDYEMRIVLKETATTAGAQYYVRGGAFTDWHLLYENSTSYGNDDLLRISVLPKGDITTIKSITVKHVSAHTGAHVDFGVAQGNGATCYSFDNLWPTITPDYTKANHVMADSVGTIDDLSVAVVDGVAELQWTPATTDETEFRIERDCTGSSYDTTFTIAAGSTSYTDSPLPGAVSSCSYVVRAYKGAPCFWTSDPSNLVNIDIPPTAPVVAAQPTNSFMLRVYWLASGGEDGFEIEQQVFGGNWKPVATVAGTETQYYIKNGINPNTQYTFRVRSFKNNSYSAYDSATTTSYAFNPTDTTCAP
jgi:hypothetical protein